MTRLTLCPLPPTLDELVDELARRCGPVEVTERHLPVNQPDSVTIRLGRFGRRDQLGGLLRSPDGLKRFWLDGPGMRRPRSAPGSFRVLAILTVRNEKDILPHVIPDLLGQGLEVFVVDDHSTDDTPKILRSFEGRAGFTGWERFPDAPDPDVGWQQQLAHKADIAAASGADWAIHSDADEIRRAPWAGCTLRDGIALAHRRGANLVDFTVVNHLPTVGDLPFEQAGLAALHHVELGLRPGYFLQAKAWRQPNDRPINLGGGHGIDVGEEPTIFPLNFVVHHYPVRSQRHGTNKIAERRTRWGRERRERGWHVHYDHVQEDHQFERPSGSLASVNDRRWKAAMAGRLLVRAGMDPDPSFLIV